MAPPARTDGFTLGEFQATVVESPHGASVVFARGMLNLGSILLARTLTRSEIEACLQDKGILAGSEICAVLDWLSPSTSAFPLE